MSKRTYGWRIENGKRKYNKATDIDEEFGITYEEVEQLQNALDRADFTEKAKPNPVIENLGRKVFKYKGKK